MHRKLGLAEGKVIDSKKQKTFTNRHLDNKARYSPEDPVAL